MRVGEARASSTPALETAVGRSLERHLLRDHPRPVAVALSGGGDSLALVLAASAWARSAGRGLVVFTVDHGLRPESAAWTKTCAAIAERLGVPFRALAWTGEKPATGLPAAARQARHGLLADAARETGARVILMGHTADDSLEARVMRAEGSTTPEPREWSPSPVWPQGRGLFLLRPMLQLRRAEIRTWLAARGEAWIDDPANEDAAYARPRARQAIAQGAETRPPSATACAKTLALASCEASSGGLEASRTDLRAAMPEAVARFASVACLCAAGTDRPPARDSVQRLAARLQTDEIFVSSLAGARVEADPARVRFLREAGEAARGGLASLPLDAGETAVWDGRFEVAAKRAVEVRADPGGTLPVAIGQDGDVTAIEARSLSYERLLAACGAIEREPA